MQIYSLFTTWWFQDPILKSGSRTGLGVTCHQFPPFRYLPDFCHCQNAGYMLYTTFTLKTFRPRQNGRHFGDDNLKCIFLNKIVWISITISLKFVLRCPLNNISALVRIMGWRRPGDKPLSEPMVVNLLTHVCITRPQRVNRSHRSSAEKERNRYCCKIKISFMEKVMNDNLVTPTPNLIKQAHNLEGAYHISSSNNNSY